MLLHLQGIPNADTTEQSTEKGDGLHSMGVVLLTHQIPTLQVIGAEERDFQSLMLPLFLDRM